VNPFPERKLATPSPFALRLSKGSVPLPLTERREKRDGPPPGKWLHPKVEHAVAFRNVRRAAAEGGSQAMSASPVAFCGWS
jgi:hypothetical protein